MKLCVSLGGAEVNWIAYNHARDFHLEPPVACGPLNLFTAPYVETAGVPPGIEAGAQGYSIVSHPAGA